MGQCPIGRSFLEPSALAIEENITTLAERQRLRALSWEILLDVSKCFPQLLQRSRVLKDVRNKGQPWSGLVLVDMPDTFRFPAGAELKSPEVCSDGISSGSWILALEFQLVIGLPDVALQNTTNVMYSSCIKYHITDYKDPHIISQSIVAWLSDKLTIPSVWMIFVVWK